MKRKIIVIVIILLGVSFFAYPYVSNYLAMLRASQVISEYDTSVREMEELRRQQRWEEARCYNEGLLNNEITDPFGKNEEQQKDDPYYDMLDVEENHAMGYISVPKIDIRLPIYHGTAEEVLQKGAGHLKGSSLPIGGEGQHSVITGHTGLVKAKYFTDLEKMEEGDIFYVHVLDQILAYEIDQIKVVEPTVVEDLKRTEGEDYCTLVTCTPYGVNSHRLLVRGTRTEYVENENEEAFRMELKGLSPLQKLLLYTAAGVIVGTVVLIILVKWIKKKKKPKKVYWWEKEN